MSYVLLDDDGLVSSLSIKKEASLGEANNVLEDRLNSVNNNICDDLIRSITESNGSVISQIGGIPTFGYEA